jgi:ribulose-5-phosphate 4-epimerase/fuculose-1-phosphate aldolase
MVSQSSVVEELDIRARIDQLIDMGKNVAERGLVVGSGGNLSFKDLQTDSFYITGTGTKLDQLQPSSFVRIRLHLNIACIWRVILGGEI